jgi:hypothetical protein
MFHSLSGEKIKRAKEALRRQQKKKQKRSTSHPQGTHEK